MELLAFETAEDENVEQKFRFDSTFVINLLLLVLEGKDNAGFLIGLLLSHLFSVYILYKMSYKRLFAVCCTHDPEIRVYVYSSKYVLASVSLTRRTWRTARLKLQTRKDAFISRGNYLRLARKATIKRKLRPSFVMSPLSCH